MKIFPLTIILLLCLFGISQHTVAQKRPIILKTSFRKDTSNIQKFGAVADGLFLNTQAINKAIEAVNKKGGGVVKVPAGLWHTGPIVLLSNVNLFLDNGAVLLFTSDFSQYPLVETNWEGLAAIRNQSPISALKATNIAITGSGIIDGNGDAWRQVKKDKLTESQWKKKLASGGLTDEKQRIWYPTQNALDGMKVPKAGVIAEGATLQSAVAYKDFLRGNLLVIDQCSKVLLEGVTFQNSAAWCLHPLRSSHLTIRNLMVKNPWYAQNGDGLDIESCSNVLVENCIFDVGDDGICIKSGRDEEGRARAMPTQDVIVRNCVVYHAHGGFVIGSEMSGGARNIFVENCSFIGTDIGLRFKTTRGRGGLVENIFIKDITMKDIPGDAILFDMYYAAVDPVPMAGEKRMPPPVEMKTVDETTPRFQNFTISNVMVNGADKAIFIRGLPEMNVKNVVLKNMVLQATNGIDCQEANGIVFQNIQLLTKETNPMVYLLNSQQIVFDKLKVNNGAALLLHAQGDRTKQVVVKNSSVGAGTKMLQADYGANAENIKMN